MSKRLHTIRAGFKVGDGEGVVFGVWPVGLFGVGAVAIR